jgi:hypothetical protein
MILCPAYDLLLFCYHSMYILDTPRGIVPAHFLIKNFLWLQCIYSVLGSIVSGSGKGSLGTSKLIKSCIILSNCYLLFLLGLHSRHGYQGS